MNKKYRTITEIIVGLLQPYRLLHLPLGNDRTLEVVRLLLAPEPSSS